MADPREVDRRVFAPRITRDLTERARAWMGATVTVRGWFPNVALAAHPEYAADIRIGYVQEFEADVPESDLLPIPHGGTAQNELSQVDDDVCKIE
ncbi:MAG: hypothetical protein ABI548_25275 [Polyangiaceae bacterium]